MNYDRLKKVYWKTDISLMNVKSGQFLYLHEKVWDWWNQRIWRFKWLVIKVRKPNHPDGAFTIRWKIAWVNIEKVYPLSFRNFSKVELLDEYKIRRSKLYYIREKLWKDAKFKTLINPEIRGKDILNDNRKFSSQWPVVKKEAELIVDDTTIANDNVAWNTDNV